MPNVIGMTKEEVMKQHYPFHIHWYGEGSRIVDQVPKENELMNQDETLHLYLSD